MRFDVGWRMKDIGTMIPAVLVFVGLAVSAHGQENTNTSTAAVTIEI